MASNSNFTKLFAGSGAVTLVNALRAFAVNKLLAVFLPPAMFACVGQFLNLMTIGQATSSLAMQNGWTALTAQNKNSREKLLGIWRGGFRLTTFASLFTFIVAVVFYILFRQFTDGDSYLRISALGIDWNLGWFYGVFILFLLVGSSNAVNLTDGLDGLAGGLSAISFLAFAIIAMGSWWIEGNSDIGIFCFVLVGALMGFLVYNSNPAKVFMGDTGSLTLGATMATVAILTSHELSLVLIGGVFVIETLTVIIQITSVVLFKKKVFLMTPIHHHFERLGWRENDIVKLFWIVGFILCMLALIYGVWL